jgi:Putative zinc-finger
MVWFRRKEHPDEAELSAYLDGQVSPHRAGDLRSHADACERCRPLLEELRSAKSTLVALPRVMPSRSFVLAAEHARARPAVSRPRALSFAPAVALTVLVALLAVDFIPSSNGTTSTATDSAPAIKVAGEGAAQDRTALQPPLAQTPILPQAAQPSAADANRAAAPNILTAPAPAGAAPGNQGGPAPATAAPFSAEAGRVAPTPSAPPPAPAETSKDDDGGGLSLLRALEIVAALAFAGSLVLVAWPHLRREGGANR